MWAKQKITPHEKTPYLNIFYAVNTQPVFTCSKLAVEKLEQGVKYVQNWQWKHQNNDAIGVVLMSLLLTLNIFHTLL